jgi:hypothetical protein
MTADEHEALARAAERFWVEFSALANRYIDEQPESLRDYFESMLGDKTSIYGRVVHRARRPTS